MKCGRCARDAPKLFNGVCGICDINRTRQFPGVSGFDYPHQVHPERPDEVKALDGALRALVDHKDERQRMSDKEAAQMHTIWKRDQEQRQAAEAAVPLRDRQAETERVQEQELATEQALTQAQLASKRKLREMQPVFERWRREVTAGDNN